MSGLDSDSLRKARLEEYFLNLELRLLDPDVRRSRSHLVFLIHDDYKEFGTTGRVYSKGSIVGLMLQEQSAETTIRDFAIRRLSEEVVLVTYRSVERDSDVRRSSIWLNNDGRWQIVFHQGTRLPGRLRSSVDPISRLG